MPARDVYAREGSATLTEELLSQSRAIRALNTASAMRAGSAILRACGTSMYCRCMSRTNIDIDEHACKVVMERYHLNTKRDAVNFALRTVAGEPLSTEKARRLRGSGSDGSLHEVRTSRAG